MSERKTCLLIVDDETDFRYIVRYHFEKRGYEVLEAADGEEAFERFYEDPMRIDLVITDIKMPRMGGEELIRKIRSRSTILPIIGITGHDDIKGKLSSLAEGAYYFIDKPVLEDHWPFVDRMVENAVKLHNRERELESFRAQEQEIARMMRHYILQRPVERALLWAEHVLAPVHSNEPSGDYVECFHRSRDELLFYVADVSGRKDILPAFAALLSNMVFHRIHHDRRPTVNQIILEIDHALEGLRMADAFPANRLLTFFIGILNLTNGHLNYVNAGYLPGLLLRRSNGDVEVMQLPPTSSPVGHVSLSDTEVEEGNEWVQPGDVLFLYSDGVTASLAEGDETDHSPTCIRKLEELVKPLASGPLQELTDKVMEHLKDRVGEFMDDTTLLAIRLHEVPGDDYLAGLNMRAEH